MAACHPPIHPPLRRLSTMMVLEVSLMAAVQNDMLVVTTTSESAEGMRLQVAQQHAN
jgi:hypothetical protein